MATKKTVLTKKGINEVEFVKDNFMCVTSFRGIEKRKLFYTINHELIKGRLSNRNGLQERRVKYFMKSMQEGKFDFHIGSIFVSIENDVVLIDEGHHRFEAARRLNVPIVFSVTETNTVDKIAYINSSLPQKWTEMDHFYSALTDNYPLAVEIDKILKIVTKCNDVTRSNLKPHDFYALLTRKVVCFTAGNNAPKRVDYLNENFVVELQSQNFKKELQALIDVKVYLKGIYTKEIIKAIFGLHFNDNPNFNLYQFVDHIKKHGFDFDTDKKNDIKQIAINVLM